MIVENRNEIWTYPKWELFFYLFILIQPYLDLIAYLGIPVSMIVRVGAMAAGLIYLIVYPYNRIKWACIGYLFLLGLFIGVNTAINYMTKEPYFLVQEAGYGIKSIYVIEMLLVYTAIFYNVKAKWDWRELLQKVIYINMLVIGIVLLLADLTDTGSRSYGTISKFGHSGWFFSANDLSAILAMGFGISVMYMLNRRRLRTKLSAFPGVLLIVWSMYTVGTKVGLGTVMIVIGTYMAIVLAGHIWKKRNWTNVLLLAAVLLFSVLYLPYSAIGHNIQVSFYNADINEQNMADHTKDFQITQRNVLSGRGQFFRNTLNDWKQAPLMKKLFGMGPGGNYEENLKMIEMDFLDWFFGYGVIGFLLLLLPFVYFGIMIFKQIAGRKLWQPQVIMVGIVVILGIGIAAVAGHIFLNPASGIYFDLALGCLYVTVFQRQT